MLSRWRPVLAVIVATCALAGGVVAVVLTQTAGEARPGGDPLAACLSAAADGGTADCGYFSYTAYVEISARPLPPTPGRVTPPSTPPPSPRPRPALTVDTGCDARGPADLAPVDDAVTRRVNRAWERIESWLARHAPATAATLNPPATSERIARAQADMGVRIPGDLIASLRRHDGVRIDNLRTAFSLPSLFAPMSVDRMVSDWRVRCDVLKTGGENGSVVSWWHGKYVPFAEDFGGDCLFLNQLDEPRGRVGWASHEDGVHYENRPGSLTDLLEQTADALEGRGPLLARYRPTVTAERALDWEIR